MNTEKVFQEQTTQQVPTKLTQTEKASADTLVEEALREAGIAGQKTTDAINKAPEKYTATSPKVGFFTRIRDTLLEKMLSPEEKILRARKEKIIAEQREKVAPELQKEFDKGVEKWGLGSFVIEDGKAIDIQLRDPMKDPLVKEGLEKAEANGDREIYLEGIKKFGKAGFQIVDHKLIQRVNLSTRNGG